MSSFRFLIVIADDRLENGLEKFLGRSDGLGGVFIDPVADAVFMRDVYHHFTHPAEIDASLLRALKPGGLLAVIDFPPSKALGLIAPVKGAPRNRGGHGIPQKVLIDELSAAGFQAAVIPTDWPGRSYCVVFRKPPENH